MELLQHRHRPTDAERAAMSGLVDRIADAAAKENGTVHRDVIDNNVSLVDDATAKKVLASFVLDEMKRARSAGRAARLLDLSLIQNPYDADVCPNVRDAWIEGWWEKDTELRYSPTPAELDAIDGGHE